MKAKPALKLRRSHIFEKETDGWYVEPSWCSERLFEVESFGPRGSLVIDPACGMGRIVASAMAAGYHAIGSDIVERYGCEQRDFLTDDLPRNYVGVVKIGRSERQVTLVLPNRFSIVCNPPFDLIEQFCRRALQIGAFKIAMITPLRRLPAAHWLQDLPLKTIYFLTPRPSMPPGSYIESGKKPGNGSQDFCWLMFTTGYNGAPQMKWLHRDAYASPVRGICTGNKEENDKCHAGDIRRQS
jgi:hypothetical protein